MAHAIADAKFDNLFATPMMSYIWKDSTDLNSQLQERILTHEAQDPGMRTTNVGGWHSGVGMLEFCGDARFELIRRMKVMVNEATRRTFRQYGKTMPPLNWTVAAWANVNRSGDYNGVHHHPHTTWSGTYYVGDGNAPSEIAQSTPIQLFDPCSTRSLTFFPQATTNSVSVPPQPGLMILFPSYLPHMVPPHTGMRPRISVAFSLRNEPFP